MLQKSTVEKETLGLLKELQSRPLLDSFLLVGGTALALYMGHRKSIDLDLFSSKPFNVYVLQEFLNREYGFQASITSEGTLLGYIKDVKVDFIHFPYEVIRPPLREDGLAVASMPDIVAMKLSAIVKSGKRIKDFIDISYLSSHYTLNEMLDFYKERFPSSNKLFPLKALTYFEDIDFDEQVVMLNADFSWRLVKERLLNMFNHPDRLFREPPLAPKREVAVGNDVKRKKPKGRKL